MPVPSWQLSIKAPGYSKNGTVFDQHCQNGKLFLRCPQSFRGKRARSTEGSRSVTLDLSMKIELSLDMYLTRGATHSLELCTHQTKGMGMWRGHIYKLRWIMWWVNPWQTADSLTAQLSARRGKQFHFHWGYSRQSLQSLRLPLLSPGLHFSSVAHLLTLLTLPLKTRWKGHKTRKENNNTEKNSESILLEQRGLSLGKNLKTNT